MPNPSLYPLDFDNNEIESSLVSDIKTLKDDRYIGLIRSKLEQAFLLTRSIALQNHANKTYDQLNSNIGSLLDNYVFPLNSSIEADPDDGTSNQDRYTGYVFIGSRIASFDRFINKETSLSQRIRLNDGFTGFASKEKVFLNTDRDFTTFSFFTHTVSNYPSFNPLSFQTAGRSGDPVNLSSSFSYGQGTVDPSNNMAYVWHTGLGSYIVSGTPTIAGHLLLTKLDLSNNVVMSTKTMGSVYYQEANYRLNWSTAVPNKIFNGRCYCFSVTEIDANEAKGGQVFTGVMGYNSVTDTTSFMRNVALSATRLISTSYTGDDVLLYVMPTPQNPFIKVEKYDSTGGEVNKVSYNYSIPTNNEYRHKAPVVMTFPESTILLFGKDTGGVYPFGYNHNHLTDVMTNILSLNIASSVDANTPFYSCSNF